MICILINPSCVKFQNKLKAFELFNLFPFISYPILELTDFYFWTFFQIFLRLTRSSLKSDRCIVHWTISQGSDSEQKSTYLWTLSDDRWISNAGIVSASQFSIFVDLQIFSTFQLFMNPMILLSWKQNFEGVRNIFHYDGLPSHSAGRSWNSGRSEPKK